MWDCLIATRILPVNVFSYKQGNEVFCTVLILHCRCQIPNGREINTSKENFLNHSNIFYCTYLKRKAKRKLICQSVKKGIKVILVQISASSYLLLTLQCIDYFKFILLRNWKYYVFYSTFHKMVQMIRNNFKRKAYFPCIKRLNAVKILIPSVTFLLLLFSKKP